MKKVCSIGRGIDLVADALPLGTDSILLSAFAAPLEGKVCDLGCGAGYVMLLSALRSEGHDFTLTGIDIRESAILRAKENLSRAGLSASLISGDLRDPSILPPSGFDIAVSNPPYIPVSSGLAPEDEEAAVARMEYACTLSDLTSCAFRILRPGGWLYLVYPAHRLTDLLASLRAQGLEPKKLRFFARDPASAPILALVAARRGGKPQLDILPSLFIGSEEHKKIFAPFE
ncbi:MAG: methyltransferase [Oscillospiraceae bacterium]|nr:methyltransferase [Oscillospiraceae bacterium]